MIHDSFVSWEARGIMLFLTVCGYDYNQFSPVQFIWTQQEMLLDYRGSKTRKSDVAQQDGNTCLSVLLEAGSDSEYWGRLDALAEAGRLN